MADNPSSRRSPICDAWSCSCPKEDEPVSIFHKRQTFSASDIGFTLNGPVDHPEPVFDPKPMRFFR